MSARSDQETDETFETDEVYHHDDDPYAESPTETQRQESLLPYFPAAPWGWWPFGGSSDGDTEYGTEAHDEYGERRHEDDSSSGLWGLWDESLITLLIVGGAVLFLFPEPATSALGILLMGVGLVAWLVDWAT